MVKVESPAGRLWCGLGSHWYLQKVKRTPEWAVENMLLLVRLPLQSVKVLKKLFRYVLKHPGSSVGWRGTDQGGGVKGLCGPRLVLT